ncbi:phage terminase large subunit [Arsenicicoccus dermatophilus]|uniref:phage terminase large subunit n=1 Tax=Arsenicicoccus dermatophilus TaxID=1076331 RepID=UPI003891FA57
MWGTALQRLAQQEQIAGAGWATPGDLARALRPGTVQTPALDLIDRELMWALTTPDARLIISVAPQEGKALALDTPIPTPAGWTTMGELRPGDLVLDGDGKPCTVTWVSPVWEGRDCYAVTTGDGERIIADAAHEWVARRTRNGPTRILETTDLAKPRGKAAQILTGDGLDLPDVELPLDPYVLGVWLGDGTTLQPMITSHPDDIEVRQRFTEAGWPLRHSARFAWSMIPDGWANRGGRPSPAKVALREAGVLGDKHIPAVYLRAGRAQRLALLQGLIDSDGYVMPKGQVEFCSTNLRLAEGVRELIYTLGAKAVMTTGRATLNGRDCGPKYRVRFYLADAAHLARKARRCKDSSVANVRYVTASPCESVPTVCIEVDSPDHTFLAGRTMLPTHNSERASRAFPELALTRNPDLRVIIASYSAVMARRWGRVIRDDIGEHGLAMGGLAVRPDVSAQHEWMLEGHIGGVYTVGVGGSLTGKPCDLMIIDDPVKDRAEAASALQRDKVWDWWTSTASSRLAPGAPVVVIMTRWHEDDFAGRLLAAEDGYRWRVVNIPAQCDDPDNDPLGRQYGEFMVSARGRTREQWEQRKITAGSRDWAALYQGRPTPSEGSILKPAWWKRWDAPPYLVRDDGARIIPDTAGLEVVQSWDMAFKGSDTSDFVVGQVWMRRGHQAWLLAQVRGRWSFAETVQQVRALTARWPQAIAKLVEDKANGPAVISALQSQLGGFIPVLPEGSKTSRVEAVSPVIEAGQVIIPPDSVPWVGDFLAEVSLFPAGKHDDQVDAMSQAVHRLLVVPMLTGVVWDAEDVLGDEGALDLGWATDDY